MTKVIPEYEDYDALFQVKERWRAQMAGLSWEEKIAIVERMNRELRRDLWRSAPRHTESRPDATDAPP